VSRELSGLDDLSRMERLAFWLAHLAATRFRWLSVFWASRVMINLVRTTTERRVRVEGLEHIAGLHPRQSVVLVSNHRSFFDFYVIAALLFLHSRASRNTLFPVRANFFYTNPLGPLVNGLMSGMQMFPPLLRDDRGRHFNRLSMARLARELRRPGTVVGIHPEGTRGKGPDPYQLRRARPGVGQLALDVPEAPIIPVFILGMSNRIYREAWRNWVTPARFPIDVRFGPPVDLRDLLDHQSGLRLANQMDDLTEEGILPQDVPVAPSREVLLLRQRVADRCLDAIAALGAEVRARREGVPVPDAAPARLRA
jgi:1-acyl-sn-glycerol-3-phosphate acyltransferase